MTNFLKTMEINEANLEKVAGGLSNYEDNKPYIAYYYVKKCGGTISGIKGPFSSDIALFCAEVDDFANSILASGITNSVTCNLLAYSSESNGFIPGGSKTYYA